MYSTSVLILVAILGLVVGALLAFLAVRGRGGASVGVDRTQELELRLQEANKKLEDFQLQVNEHFDQTAQLVHNLTDSYREVHEYLANSALRLSSQEIGRQMLEAGSGKLSEKGEQLQGVEPPRDWAPKEPGAKGTLAEDFGLDKEPLSGTEGAANR